MDGYFTSSSVVKVFAVVTVLTNMIPQQSLTGKRFATMFTHQRLCLENKQAHDKTRSQRLHSDKSSRICPTYRLGLPEEVVEQLCVAGEHAATHGTGDESFLSVAPHVFPQPIPNLEEGVAACDGTKRCPDGSIREREFMTLLF